MSNLSFDHPQLYKNVRAKAVVHTAYGLSLFLLPVAPVVGHQATITTTVGNMLGILGIVYLIIGALIWMGLYLSKNTYSFARGALTLAAVYDLAWCILLLLVFSTQPNRSIGWIAIGYFYLTYRVWKVRNDPGWAAIELVKHPDELKELADGSVKGTP